MNNISILTMDNLNVVFSFLPLRDIGRVGRVCKQWKTLANNCKVKKNLVTDLINRKLLKSGNSPNAKELCLIASMLEEKSTNPRIVSKFIRSSATEQTILKVIDIAKEITTEQLIDAFDSTSSLSIFTALTMKIPQVSESCFVSAIRKGNIDTLKLFLNSNKANISKEWLLSKTLEHKSYKVLEFLFQNYPELEISLNLVVNITFSYGFEIALKQFLKKETNKITVDELKIMGRQAAYLHGQEKIFELITDAYVKTNQIKSVESLMENSNCALFINENNYPALVAKLIESAEKVSKE